MARACRQNDHDMRFLLGRQESQRDFSTCCLVQWNLSNTDILGTKILVLVGEVSLFQGKNNICLYKVGTPSSVLINQVSFKRFHYSSNPSMQEKHGILGQVELASWEKDSCTKDPG